MVEDVCEYMRAELLCFGSLICLSLTWFDGVSLALNQKFPRRISEILEAGQRGEIALVMERQGLVVHGRYSVNPTDGCLAVTSRWKKFIEGTNLAIGTMVKVKVCRCLPSKILVLKFLLVVDE